MSKNNYSKFRGDLLEWCRYYRGIVCPTSSRTAVRALRGQMRMLRDAYYHGGPY